MSSVIAALVCGALVFALVPVVALAASPPGSWGCCLPLVVVNWRAASRRRCEPRGLAGCRRPPGLGGALRARPARQRGRARATPGQPSTRAAFREFEAQYRRTGNFALCLDELKDALADPVADRILETLRMSREVGGSELTTVLRNLAAYLRQEAAIRAEVEARQSWVMNAARLGVAAPWIVLLLLASRPEAAAAYNTAAGVAVIVGGLVVSVVAYRIMIGIGRMPEERRWFQ